MPALTPQNAKTFAGLTIDESTEQKTGLFVGIYGPGGSGKTTTIARIVESPRIKRALLIDCEGGSASVKHLVPQGLEIVHANNWNDVRNIRREIKKEDHGYDAILWDHLSEITNLFKMQVAPNGIPEIQQWNQILAEMMAFVREQRLVTINQGVHVLFNVWEEEKEDKELEILKQRVNLFRSWQAAFPGMVTMLGRLTPYSTKPPYVRKLSFIASDKTDSKYRVSPTDAAALIPQELYLRWDNNFIVDFMNAVCYGEPFDDKKYAKKQGE
jgi:hypothetical protein